MDETFTPGPAAVSAPIRQIRHHLRKQVEQSRAAHGAAVYLVLEQVQAWRRAGSPTRHEIDREVGDLLSREVVDALLRLAADAPRPVVRALLEEV